MAVFMVHGFSGPTRRRLALEFDFIGLLSHEVSLMSSRPAALRRDRCLAGFAGEPDHPVVLRFEAGLRSHVRSPKLHGLILQNPARTILFRLFHASLACAIAEYAPRIQF